MATVSIPMWNNQGVLPPINTTKPTSTDRSPYLVSLTDLILRYTTSIERKDILLGFLRFRSVLHAVGLNIGFQWIDGSFLENVELIENRSPHDLDVVTFYFLPHGQTQQNLFSANPHIFTPAISKLAYQIDAYFVQLNQGRRENLVRQSAYWYSVWSHRRNDLWKGFLQVDLSPVEDQTAQANLIAITNIGGKP
ncbi:MAG: hypothetical protein AB1656_20225 [Candidatus Omnitrophota bacterium]